MLTNTAEYAIRAVAYVAAEAGVAPVRVEAVAASLDIPRNYLSKVMHTLSRAGVLHSTRGVGGGFTLARPAEELTIAEVIRPFDLVEDRCLLMRRPCTETDSCLAHRYWQDVALQVRAFFRTTTVADLVREPAVSDDTPLPENEGTPGTEAPCIPS